MVCSVTCGRFPKSQPASLIDASRKIASGAPGATCRDMNETAAPAISYLDRAVPTPRARCTVPVILAATLEVSCPQLRLGQSHIDGPW